MSTDYLLHSFPKLEIVYGVDDRIERSVTVWQEVDEDDLEEAVKPGRTRSKHVRAV